MRKITSNGWRRYRASFEGLPREAWLCALGLLINRAGTMVVPFLSLYLTAERGVPKSTVGVLLSGFGAGSIVGSLLGGHLSTRLGAITIQKVSLGLTGALLLVLPRLEGVVPLAVCVFLIAVVGDAYRPAVMTALAEYGGARSGRAIALGRLAINLGLTIGPALGGFLAERSYEALFVVDAATCWAAAIFLTFMLRGDPRARRVSRSPMGGAAAWRDPRMRSYALTILLVGIVFFQMTAAMPLYLVEVYHLPERAFGSLLALNCALIVLFEMPVVHALEHCRPMRITAIGMMMIGGGMGLLPFGSGMLFAAFTVVVWSIGEMVAVPASNVYVTSLAGEGRLGQYMGVYTAVFGVAQVIAPAAGLFVFSRYGGDMIWYGTTVLGAIVMVRCLLADRADQARARLRPASSHELAP